MKKLLMIALLTGVFVLPAIQPPAMAQLSYYRTGDLIGKTAVNRQGQELGRIDDVISDRNGRIRYMLIRPGFAQMSNRWVPVPWNAADVFVRDDDVVVDLPRATLRNAPYFRRGTVPDLGQWENRIMSYYGLGAPYEYRYYGYEPHYYEPYEYGEPYQYEPDYEPYEYYEPYSYYGGREGAEVERRHDRAFRHEWEEQERRMRPPRYFRGNEQYRENREWWLRERD